MVYIYVCLCLPRCYTTNNTFLYKLSKTLFALPSGEGFLTQPTGNIGNLSASRRCLWVRNTAVFTVWRVLPVFHNLSYQPQRRRYDVLPVQRSHQNGYNTFSSSWRVTKGKLCATLQAMAPTNVKIVHLTSLFPFESNADRLELLSPAHGQRSQQQTLQSGLINKPKFLKGTRHAETRKTEIPRSMVVEALSW